MKASHLLSIALFVAGCSASGDEAEATSWVEVRAEAGSDLDIGTVRVSPHDAIASMVVSATRLFVKVSGGSPHDFAITAEGACPIRVGAGELVEGRTLRRTLVPFVDIGRDRPEIGFDTAFEIEAKARCPEAEKGSIAWEHKGAALSDVKTTGDGRKFAARTAPLPATRPWGVVPFSPRTRAEAELSATWSAPGSPSVKRTIHVAAAARAHGLPNVAVGTRLHLGGKGWHVVSAPANAHAAVAASGNSDTLAPDVAGRWELSDGEGKALRLVAASYGGTPIDCGRSECHQAIAASARSSPMTSVLSRGIDGRFGPGYPSCALGCHAVGEPGADDGGFTAVLRELGWSSSDLVRSGWQPLPPSIRRVGGVGCLACHGPGAIPEESTRHTLLRADVCAYCHDAPPRYGHVDAWRGSRMSRSDADPRTQGDACARCHTTWGFLGQPARKPPEGSEPVGIACAACHSVHPVTGGGREAGRCEDKLTRASPPPELVGVAGSPKNFVCLSCHSPTATDDVPRASAAAIWAGKGGLDPESGGALEAGGPPPATDCIGCHNDGPGHLQGGRGHSFRAPRAAADAALQERARKLWSGATVAPAPGGAASDPVHAGPARLDRGTPRGRALWNVALVLEDPAADVHGPAYARKLLDAAERALSAGRAP